ncbi:MAG TPA: Mov34/MPN/PAD-1 family protein [Ancylobacter sp.]
MLAFCIGSSGQRLVLTDEVLAHFDRHRQVLFRQPEAGGQLFAHFSDVDIVVIEATGPRSTDRRTRTRYEPDSKAEQREIDERFTRGLHFVGDWHTHAERHPSPSGLDLRSTADGFNRSRHTLSAFVLILVGQDPFPHGLRVLLHDGNTCVTLTP